MEATYKMKNRRWTFIAILLCISLIVPQFSVLAVLANEGDDNTKNTKIEETEESDEKEDEEENEEENEEDLEKSDASKNIEKDDESKKIDAVSSDEIKAVSSDELEAVSSDEIKAVSADEIKKMQMLPKAKKAATPMLLASPPGPGPASGEHGSGSYQLNKVPGDYRFYTEYFVAAEPGSNKSTTSAGIERKTTIKVYAKAGEILLFGSSVHNSQIDEYDNTTGSVTGKDIVITDPDGYKWGEDVVFPGDKDGSDTLRPNGLGYIKNSTQEKNGPMVNYDDETHPEDYYVPLRYDVTKSGVYTFEFHSVTGYNPGSAPSGYHPSPKKASEEWAQGNTAVAAWDITVLGKNSADKWEVKSGRAWADYLALTTGGGEGIESDLDVYVLTHDGYQYKVDFKKAVPYGFIFFANNTGFMTPEADGAGTFYRPIYHSFYDSTNDLDHMLDGENIHLHKPTETDSETEETYKIFFNAPNDDLDGVSVDGSGSESSKLKTKPDEEVTLTDLAFTGIDENLARSGHGGHFTFKSSGEAMVTIRLDLRKAILDSEGTMDSYEGTGIVEITAPAHKNQNSFYWDGKDTEGYVLPAGIYGNSNVVLSSEVKRGEIHFPVIDMEGLYDGLTIERKNGKDTGTESCFNLYYNNNPLLYGTIEGNDVKRVTASKYDILSDGTKSYKTSSATYFTGGEKTISTLVKDTKDYLALILFEKNYSALDSDDRAIIDAEFGKELDTYHFEPVNSKEISMKFQCKGYLGGGDKAGIDTWTYYSQGVHSSKISFAILDNQDRGMVRGQIFYDANTDSKYDTANGDYLLSNIKVRLIDSAGKPVVHEESLPCFDATGHFIYDENGKVKHEPRSVKYETVTDASGYYRFTGVPYDAVGTDYYVQVMLTDVQSEVLRYTCTTSEQVKSKYIDKAHGNTPFLNYSIEADYYGADGNAIEEATGDISKIYGHRYKRETTEPKDTIFDIDNAQKVNLSSTSPIDVGGVVHVADFKKIGFSSTVPAGNLKDYQVSKDWGTSHKISDGLIVELWVWNDAAVLDDDSTLELSRRTGALMDTQVLNNANSWTYTWKNLDDRLQYYVLEYYTKKKPNGEIIYNDKGEPRKVLIGGTMPIFSAVPAGHSDKYGFKTNLGDYPETKKDSDGKVYIPIQKFGDIAPNIHANSITKKEKLESVDNNARQYDVTYKLSVAGTTNKIELMNNQVYDDRTYYVWLGHEAKLPDFVGMTYVQDGKKNSHAVTLHKDELISGGEYTITGLSVSSVDAANSDNVEGNATKAFRIAEDGTNVLFTATNQGNYKTGTGTRTYQVKYVVDSTGNPVRITTNQSHELVLAGNESIKVEAEGSPYKVYSWYMTIHVYDVQSDGVIEYDPNNGPVILQEALPASGDDHELTWKLTHYGDNSVAYTSNDKRTFGILRNDTYRLPLYKAAENPHMGSCADLVGIAYAGPAPVDDITLLPFADTYESRYGTLDDGEDGVAIARGSGGYVTVNLNTTRITRINRIQDHANYANVTFTPGSMGRAAAGEDVFYYKIIVFAEDSTYQYANYEDIDASEGVVMYAYFIMKPKQGAPNVRPNEGPNNNYPGSSSGNPSGDPNGDLPIDPNAIPTANPALKPTIGPDDSLEKDANKSIAVNANKDANSPKTGEDRNAFWWLVLVYLAIWGRFLCHKKRHSGTSNKKES